MKAVDLTLDAACEGGQSGWWGSRRTLGGYTGRNFWQRDKLWGPSVLVARVILTVSGGLVLKEEIHNGSDRQSVRLDR